MYLKNYESIIENLYNILSNKYSFKVINEENIIRVELNKKIRHSTSDECDFYNDFLCSFLTPFVLEYKYIPLTEINIIELEFKINNHFNNLLQSGLRERLYEFYFSQVNNDT